MKKIFILLFIFFNAYTVFNNTEARSPQKQHVDWIEELNLKGEQKKQVEEIYKESQTRVKSLTRQIEEINQEIAEIHQSDDEKIRLLLNEKQRIDFDKIKLRNNKSLLDSYKEKGSKKPSRKRMRQY